MGEIRFVGTGETHGYPYLVCKKTEVEIQSTHVISKSKGPSETH